MSPTPADEKYVASAERGEDASGRRRAARPPARGQKTSQFRAQNQLGAICAPIKMLGLRAMGARLGVGRSLARPLSSVAAPSSELGSFDYGFKKDRIAKTTSGAAENRGFTYLPVS